MSRGIRTGSNEVDDAQRTILSLERVFYHDASKLILRGEVLNLAIAKLTHERRFPGPVRTKNAVSASTNKA